VRTGCGGGERNGGCRFFETDIAASIRVPAACCGIVGLKSMPLPKSLNLLLRTSGSDAFISKAPSRKSMPLPPCDYPILEVILRLFERFEDSSNEFFLGVMCSQWTTLCLGSRGT
jgi:hypothetical protein